MNIFGQSGFEQLLLINLKTFKLDINLKLDTSLLRNQKNQKIDLAITLKLAAPSTIHAVHWNDLKRDRFWWKSIIQEPFIDRDGSLHQLLKANLFKSTVWESGATATAAATSLALNDWLWFWIIYTRQKINVKIFSLKTISVLPKVSMLLFLNVAHFL